MPAETHMEGPPPSRDEVLQLVRDTLADVLSVDVDEVGEDDRLAEDLHADSLALVELVDTLEEELSERTAGFEFDDDDLAGFRTVRDAVDYVMVRLGA